jgi:hypothetical protein
MVQFFDAPPRFMSDDAHPGAGDDGGNSRVRAVADPRPAVAVAAGPRLSHPDKSGRESNVC